MENNTLLPLALTYLSKGWNVIPVGFDKRPLVSWKEYQTRKTTPEELVRWFTEFPEAQIGIVTGSISNLTVIDFEQGADFSLVKDQTFKVKTGGGGEHAYFEYEKDFRNAVKVFPLVDQRSEGGYVVAAGSRSSKGAYEALNNLEAVKMSPETKELFLKAKGDKAQDKNWKETFVQPLEQGSRNNNFASIIGGLLMRFPMDEWESVVWPTVNDKNKLQQKPLSPTELRTTFNSIAKIETQRRHQGGDIKDIITTNIGEDLRVDIRLEQVVVSFKIKNIISSLAEATSIAWISKATGLTHEIPFYLKIKSDTNKEQWVRILSKAFDKKENKETYPWTIIVAKVVAALENQIRTRQQDYTADTIEEKSCTWLWEPYIQEDMINTVFGMGSSGKTLLSLFFAKNIAQMLNHSILFIDYEDTAGGWKGKLARITGPQEFSVLLNKFVYFDSEQIPIAEQVDKIKEVIKKHNIKLVIVDSASLATGESTSDEKAAVRLVSALKLLRTTVLLIAHQRKNNGDETPIGSIQYENQSRNVWNVKGTRDDRDDNVIHIAMTHTKANNTFLRRDPKGFNVNYGNDKIVIKEESASSHFQEKYSVISRIDTLLRMQGEMTAKEISSELGVNLQTVRTNLSRGKERNIFDHNMQTEMYSIRKPQDDGFVKV